MPRTGRKLKLNAEQVAQIGADWKAGVQSDALAEKYGISRNIVYAYLSMAGVRPVKSRKRLSRLEVERLLRQHGSQFEVARELKVSHKVLRDHLLKWGMTSKAVAEVKAERVGEKCPVCQRELFVGMYKLVVRQGQAHRVCLACELS